MLETLQYFNGTLAPLLIATIFNILGLAFFGGVSLVLVGLIVTALCSAIAGLYALITGK